MIYKSILTNKPKYDTIFLVKTHKSFFKKRKEIAMKKSIFKKVLCLMLTLLMLFTFIPLTTYAATAPNGFVMMRQTDSPWHTVYVNGGSLAGTGCGMFSFVNAVGYLTGAKLDVVEVAKWAHSIGSFNVTYGGDGTYRTSFYPRASQKYGPMYGFTIDCADGTGYWSSVNNSKLKNHLKNGGVAVAHVYNHFIAIMDYDSANNTFLIWDCAPASRRGTNVNGGALWLSQSYLTSEYYMTIDWFCLLSSTTPPETWQEKAAFDAMVYRDRNQDLAGLTDEQLKDHWKNHGIKEGRASSPVLDLGFYLNNNPDLKDAFGTDYEKVYNHFITKGYKEKRKSSALFDGKYYTEHYPDAAAKGDDYMKYYVEHGILAGHRASLTFDPDYYWFIYPSVYEVWPAHYEMCAKHYAGHGIREGVIAYDNQLPVISDVVFSDITADGYKVTCKVTDNWEISFVSFPTWTVANDQDDLAADFFNTQRGTKDGDTYTFYVKASDHNNEGGLYATHIYAQDRGGNLVSVAPEAIEVKDGAQDVTPGTPDNGLSEITLVGGSNYVKDGNVVNKVSSATKVDSFLKQFENKNLVVKDASGNEISNSDFVGTGATVLLYDGANLVDMVSVVVLGDVDGTGIIDGTDYLRVKSKFLGTLDLDNNQTIAADVDKNGIIDGTDYMRIKGQFLGTFEI